MRRGELRRSMCGTSRPFCPELELSLHSRSGADNMKMSMVTLSLPLHSPSALRLRAGRSLSGHFLSSSSSSVPSSPSSFFTSSPSFSSSS